MKEEPPEIAAFSKQHQRAAMAATAASVVLHLLLIYWLTLIDLGAIVAPVRRAFERHVPPLQVEEVQTLPVPEDPVLNPSRPTYRAAATDLAREAAVRSKLPDEVTTEPPAAKEEWLAADEGNLEGPSPAPKRSEWQPRREMLQIDNPVAADRVDDLARRTIPRIERAPEAPDVVAAVDRSRIGDPVVAGSATGGGGGGHNRSVVFEGKRPVETGVETPVVREQVKELEERRPVVTRYTPIEQLLQVELEVYEEPKDPQYAYFRMNLHRAGESVMPVMPKDIVFVQDCSASMSEQRMFFCRDGLQRSLKLLQPGDRFNIVAFRDTPYTCFPGWATNSPESIAKAQEFITQLKAEGTTDIYATLRTLLALPRDPLRPVVAFLISDGRPTTGVTESSDIIGQFSKENEGAISAFTLGTIQTANSYLLELVSYCNRGGFNFIRSGRWGIADDMEALQREFSRPVLGNVQFRFADASRSEVYPVLTENLYLDRSLVLHGRIPRDSERLVFQAVGAAARTMCDMVFDIDIRRAKRVNDQEIRSHWAEQKIYHLIGRYIRSTDPAVLEEIRTTSRQYRVRIPYKRSL